MAKPLGHDDADLIIEDIGHGRATSLAFGVMQHADYLSESWDFCVPCVTASFSKATTTEGASRSLACFRRSAQSSVRVRGLPWNVMPPTTSPSFFDSKSNKQGADYLAHNDRWRNNVLAEVGLYAKGRLRYYRRSLASKDGRTPTEFCRSFAMTVAEMIAAAKASVVDTDRLDALREVVADASKIYEEETSRKFADPEDLARTYSL